MGIFPPLQEHAGKKEAWGLDCAHNCHLHADEGVRLAGKGHLPRIQLAVLIKGDGSIKIVDKDAGLYILVKSAYNNLKAVEYLLVVTLVEVSDIDTLIIYCSY